MMVMRFANSIFEPIWNYKYIDHVQITVSETLSADDRAGYYDKSGAMRDMIQNHIFQLMALVAMEPPVALDATSIRDEKVKVYRSVSLPSGRSNSTPSASAANTARANTRTRTRKSPPAGYTKARGVAPGSDDRDIRGDQALHRQLALERNAVLHPHRQVPAGKAERSGGAIPIAAADAVPEAVRRPGLSQ
jgi:hypothetical protein